MTTAFQKNQSLEQDLHVDEWTSHLVVALSQDLVILTERYQEDNGSDVFKAVDPLPPL